MKKKYGQDFKARSKSIKVKEVKASLEKEQLLHADQVFKRRSNKIKIHVGL